MEMLWERLSAGERVEVYHRECDPEGRDPFSLQAPGLDPNDEGDVAWITCLAVVDNRAVRHSDGLWYPYKNGVCLVEVIAGKSTGFRTEEAARHFLEQPKRRAKYHYQDFENHNTLHYTRGQFVCWQRGGILNAVGAVFLLQTSTMFIPKYLLPAETLALLPVSAIGEE